MIQFLNIATIIIVFNFGITKSQSNTILNIEQHFNTERRVYGCVVDTLGESIVQASVMVKDTKRGTVTDDDGSFTINVPEGTTTLEVTYYNMDTVVVLLNEKSNYNVVLKVKRNLLEGVVVYLGRIENKPCSFGKLNTVSFAEIAKRPVSNDIVNIIENLRIETLQKQRKQIENNPDIMLDNHSGIEPTDSSIIILNGEIYKEALNTINPLDIKEVLVLKNQKAIARCGFQGEKPLVFINTKNGKAIINKLYKKEIKRQRKERKRQSK